MCLVCAGWKSDIGPLKPVFGLSGYVPISPTLSFRPKWRACPERSRRNPLLMRGTNVTKIGTLHPRVIPNSFAEGEGERDLTLRLHHQERKQDYVQRFRRTIQPAPENSKHSAGWLIPPRACTNTADGAHPLRFSKGGHLERLRHETFSVSASSASYFLNRPESRSVANVRLSPPLSFRPQQTTARAVVCGVESLP